MKTIFRGLAIIMLSSCFSVKSSAQIAQVKLHGAVGDSIKSICNRFMLESQHEGKVILFVYALNSGSETECFFGIYGAGDELYRRIPSYYFYNANGVPVAVYTGFEQYIDFNVAYIDEIKALGQKTFWPDNIMMFHYFKWYCKFKNDKMVYFTKRLSKKKQNEFNLWMDKSYRK
jgi:hypothetical protein